MTVSGNCRRCSNCGRRDFGPEDLVPAVHDRHGDLILGLTERLREPGVGAGGGATAPVRWL